MSLTSVVTAFSVLVTSYFVLWNVSQFVMSGFAALQIWRYQHRRTPRSARSWRVLRRLRWCR